MRQIKNGAKFLLETGLLGEINRLVLHPRGLALATTYRTTTIGASAPEIVVEFSDSLLTTDDPEGIDFGADAMAEFTSRLRAAERCGEVRRVTEERRRLYPPNGIEVSFPGEEPIR